MAFNKDRADGPSRKRGSFHKKKKVCIFCAPKAEPVDYKDVATLSKFISPRGKILPRRNTGTCAEHQRDITLAIKRARHIALLPYQKD